MTGSLTVVGLGPGGAELVTPAVARVLAEATDLVGYGPYLDRVPANAGRQRRHASDNRVELDRARHALALAAEGRRVAVVSGGDPGVFAMAAAVFEAIDKGEPDWRALEVRVEPGVTAMLAAAAHAGAPLGADFCAISLSDNLKSWETIERRLRAASEGDFVIAIYNPMSRARPHQLGEAIEILRHAKVAETVVLLVRAAGTAEAQITTATLATVDVSAADMRTLVIVGSSSDPSHRARWAAAVGLHAARRARHAMTGGKSFEPTNTSVDAGENMASGLLGAGDHHDQQTKPARGLDLGVGRGSARVLRDEHVDALGGEEARLRICVEGAATGEEADVGRERHVARWVDSAGQVSVLWSHGEGGKLETPRGQKNAPRRFSQAGSRLLGIRDDSPAVSLPWLPGGTAKGAQRYAHGTRRGDGVGRDVNRKWMCGVDCGLDLLLSEPGLEPCAAAEAADSRRERLGVRCDSASSERQRRLEAPVVLNTVRKLTCFRGAA